MILGIGSDIIHIDRVEKLLEEFGERFLARNYTDEEIKGAARYKDNGHARASYFAKRFAAKEAFSKAIGTGFRNGLRFKHIGVINDSMGKPSLVLTDKAKELLEHAAPEGTSAICHISLCDDYPIAQATVIISTAG